MKKYIFPKHNSSALILDTETLTIDIHDRSYGFIDYTYIAKEDGVVTVNGVDKEIKAGDFILKMYTPNRDGVPPVFIVKDQELIDYIKYYISIREEENAKHSLKPDMISEDVACTNIG